MAMSDKQKLIRKIEMYSLALTDINLYLDSHPECPNGLEYYRKQKKLYNEAVDEYESTYGPMNIMGLKSNAKTWEWATTPFPWERGES